MTERFEIVLSQAQNLTAAEKVKLIKILAEAENVSEEKGMQDEKK